MSGGGDRKIKIWDMKRVNGFSSKKDTDFSVNSIQSGGVYSLEFDDTTLMCGCWDEVIKIYKFA